MAPKAAVAAEVNACVVETCRIFCGINLQLASFRCLIIYDLVVKVSSKVRN